MASDEEIILSGRELKEMRDQNPGFQRLRKEIKDCMDDYQNKVLTFRATSPSAEVAVPYHLYRFQALRELLEWIDEGIQRGERTLLDKISRQSERTRKDEKDGPPNQRQPEGINA